MECWTGAEDGLFCKKFLIDVKAFWSIGQLKIKNKNKKVKSKELNVNSKKQKFESKEMKKEKYAIRGNNKMNKLMYQLSQILRLNIDDTHIDQHLMT